MFWDSLFHETFKTIWMVEIHRHPPPQIPWVLLEIYLPKRDLLAALFFEQCLVTLRLFILSQRLGLSSTHENQSGRKHGFIRLLMWIGHCLNLPHRADCLHVLTCYRKVALKNHAYISWSVGNIYHSISAFTIKKGISWGCTTISNWS